MRRSLALMDSYIGFIATTGILLALAFMAIMSNSVSAQTGSKYANQKQTAEQAVRQTLDDIYAALNRNDAAALDRLYAEDYTLVNESGVMTTKAPRLAAIKSGELRYESASFDGVNIRVHGDAAVATYNVSIKGEFKGQAIGGRLRVTATLVRVKGRWQLLAAQATKIE